VRTVRVELTAEDIRDGRRRDCFNCPMSRAIGRAVGARVATGAGVAYITGQDCTNVDLVVLPDVVRRFMADFDWGTPARLEPFAFDLEIPESWPCRT
jgi:hypothetical protein